LREKVPEKDQYSYGGQRSDKKWDIKEEKKEKPELRIDKGESILQVRGKEKGSQKLRRGEKGFSKHVQ